MAWGKFGLKLNWNSIIFVHGLNGGMLFSLLKIVSVWMDKIPYLKSTVLGLLLLIRV